MSKPDLLRVRNDRMSLHNLLMKMASQFRREEMHQRDLVERTLMAVPTRLDLVTEEDPEEALTVLMGAIAAEGAAHTNASGTY